MDLEEDHRRRRRDCEWVLDPHAPLPPPADVDSDLNPDSVFTCNLPFRGLVGNALCVPHTNHVVSRSAATQRCSVRS